MLLRLFIIISAFIFTSSANALPAFARQLSTACSTCHVGGFGPQLTPFAIRFKLGGYTATDGGDGKVPLSAMLVEGFTHTNKSTTEDAQPHFGKNDNLSLQELSIFLAGRMTDHIGTFIQVTGNDFDRRFAMDNMDIRIADTRKFNDKDLVYGVSLNNNPTVQDVFNTVPAWRFPYMASELAPGPIASPLIDGGLGQQVIGASAYAFYDNHFYAELGGYKTISRSLRNKLNVGEDGRISSTSPYWRLAYYNHMDGQDNINEQAFHVGTFGMVTKLDPDFTHGPNNKYRDIGIDASYQFLGTREHIGAINASYINERRTLDSSFANGEASNAHGSLKRFDVAGSYHYKNTYGLTLSVFDILGNSDDLLYNTGEADAGSINGSPNSRGYTVQADYTPFGKQDSWMAPFANVRLGLQYTGYTKFNGARHNYDGLGRDAKDNNTLFAFAWFAI